MPKPPPKKYLPRGIKILFEDADVVVVEKPAGLLSVPARYEREKNALSLMTNFFRKGDTRSKKALFAVNRLDRETSGILVFAKSFAMRERFHENWERTEKTYLAVAEGRVEADAGTFESWLAEDENYRVRSVPAPRGNFAGRAEAGVPAPKFAATRYAVIRRGRGWTSLEVSLLTGRKNQIRVHFSENGHPLLGDAMYGRANGSAGTRRLALHAWRIAFDHPRTRERVELVSEPPAFFRNFL